MPATRATTLQQRQRIMELVQGGHSYNDIAQMLGLSYWTIRKWSQRTRGGEMSRLVSAMGRPRRGPLAHAHPLIRYRVLRWKRQHPAWGADYIVWRLSQQPDLKGITLPDPCTVWRYWRSFGERLGKRRSAKLPAKERPTRKVHGMWQLDFKESVDVPGVGPTTFTQARDVVGRATVLHRIHPARRADERIVKPTTDQVQDDCRIAFSEWGLPDAIQTDHASLFVDDDPSAFPTRLSLWWIGLGIEPRLIHHSPRENGSVERSHRTLCERTLSGNTFPDPPHLQAQVDTDWDEMNSQCPSRARGCHDRPPLVAHPELRWPRRLYDPIYELDLLDLQRIDAYLKPLTWTRKVNSHGRLSLGSQRYGLGRAWAGKSVSICFVPEQRAFLFKDLAVEPCKPLTLPAKGLSKAEIIGKLEAPAAAYHIQLPLFMCYPEQEQAGA
jgi:transposase